jgi:hypothetical protein
MQTETEKTIERAFATVHRPSDENLCASVGYEELKDTEPFRGRDWRDLDPAVLLRHQYALFWFTPEAFHYYLPAFLIAGIQRPRALYVITLLQILRPTKGAAAAAFARERWTLLTNSQIQALEEWLSWLLSQAKPGAKGEIEDALRVVKERFWW